MSSGGIAGLLVARALKNWPPGSGLASRPWLVVPICAAMHLTFAVGYFLDHKVSHITALHAVHVLFGWTLPFVCAISGVVALVPMALALTPFWVHLCLWPQQFLLFLMAYSALAATWAGQYPDGYKTGPVFIFSDQCYGVYLMLGHFAALWRNALLVRW